MADSSNLAAFLYRLQQSEPKSFNLIEGVIRSIAPYFKRFKLRENNTCPTGAPSKRLLAIKENYDKVIEGNLIALEIGIEKILEKCPRFKAWIEKLINRCK